MSNDSTILVLMHAEDDGPGTLPDYLAANRVPARMLRLYAGERLPDDLDGIGGIISLGGHMNIYQDREFPFLREETLFLRGVLAGPIPLLGICLGAQMIARAAETAVRRMGTMERGWKSIRLTPQARNDLLFSGLPDRTPVMQWHEDTFDLPPDGVLLATSEMCPHQAYRYKRAWGVQFHPEADRKTVTGWCDGDGVEREEKDLILSGFEENGESFENLSTTIWSNFLKLAGRV